MNLIKITELIERYELNTPSRKREKVYIRSVLYHFLRNNKMTLDRIGKMFGKGHATILHGLECYDRNKNYPDFKELIELVENELEVSCIDIPDEEKLQLTEAELDILEANSLQDFWQIKNNLIKKLSIKE
jgi:hypothetical protein